MKIRTKLVIAVLVTQIIGYAAAIQVVAQQEARILTEDVQEDTRITLGLVHDFLTTSLENVRQHVPQLQRQIEQLASDDGIVSLAVYDGDDAVLAHSKVASVGQALAIDQLARIDRARARPEGLEIIEADADLYRLLEPVDVSHARGKGHDVYVIEVVSNLREDGAHARDHARRLIAQVRTQVVPMVHDQQVEWQRLEQVIDQLVSYNVIRGIEVIAPDLSVMMSTMNTERQIDPGSPVAGLVREVMADGAPRQTRALPNGAGYSLFYPLRLLNGQASGAIRIAIEPQARLAEASEFRNNLYVVALSFSLGTALLLLFTLRHILINPLNRVRQGILDLAQGHLDRRVEVASNDELGELAEAFNDMANQRGEAEKTIFCLARFADESPAPMIRMSGQGDVLYANEAFKAVAGGHCLEAELPEVLVEACGRVLENDAQQEIEALYCGRIFNFLLVPNTERGYVNIYGRDVTERHQTDAELMKLASAIEQTADSVVITDVNGVIEYVNPTFEQVSGYERDEAVGKTPRLVKSGRHDGHFYRHLWKVIRSGRVYRNTIINRRKDGTLYYEEKTITPLKDARGEITHFVSTGRDVTERMQDHERLNRLANYDSLTGLPNRNLFADRLQHAVGLAERAGARMALLFIDIDNFKLINDSFGHSMGDALLREIASRLQASVRQMDTVARLGGDEFCVIVEQELECAEDAAHLARRILEKIAQPCILEGQTLRASASIGIALYPQDGMDGEKLVRHADTAMYGAKEQGRNTYRFYAAEMTEEVRHLLEMRSNLGQALERGGFSMHYQPIFDVASRRLVSAEALLRWQREDGVMVSPAEFIPVAEHSGLIVPIGEWVLNAVCEQQKAWKKAFDTCVTVSINVSAHQFAEPGFVDHVRRLLDRGSMHCDKVSFEITETAMMNSTDQSENALQTFHGMGIRLALDDFGTGYSSLSYLQRFPVSVLKIDRSFVEKLGADEDSTELVKNIITMAHGLHLKVVAEGVETPAQMDLLERFGCDLVQGYLLSRPLTGEEFAGMLARETALLH